MESMDAHLVAQALNYHGQQLQKVWEGERNENELVMLNLKDPNFEIYQQRQKTLRCESVVYNIETIVFPIPSHSLYFIAIKLFTLFIVSETEENV